LSGIADEKGRILHKITQPTNAHNGADDVLNRMCADIRQLQQKVCASPQEIAALVVGSPGPVYYPDGIVGHAPNLGWISLNLKQELKARLGREVVVENDANMAAMGVYYFEYHCSHRNLLYITVSTGIGGGIIINGRIYRGSTGGAGEFGHMVIDPGGAECSCGRRGCWEALASGTAIAREARELISQGRGKAILAAGPPDGTISAREVGIAARHDDPEALAIINQVAELLGRGISNLVNIFNPDMVVLAGGVAVGLQDLLLQPVTDIVNASVFKMHSEKLTINVSSMGNDIGLLGCIAFALTGMERSS
ncbi:MAG: ROK family protein, partial [Syntrophomonadaceae bacterium]|jgi:glucokinase